MTIKWEKTLNKNESIIETEQTIEKKGRAVNKNEYIIKNNRLLKNKLRNIDNKIKKHNK